MSRMPANERRKMRLGQVEQCLRSSLTIKEWCARNHIAESTMYNWIRIFRNDEKTPLPDRSSRRWMEITKEDLAGMVAIAPAKGAPGMRQGLRKPSIAELGCETGSGAPPDCAGMPDTPIRVRINIAEIMLPPGASQQDIDRVFKAAASL